VDQAQLRELLGEAELRELLDASVLEQLELSLQGLEAGHKARSPDRLHDLLLRVGDLSLEEVVARAEPALIPHPGQAPRASLKPDFVPPNPLPTAVERGSNAVSPLHRNGEEPGVGLAQSWLAELEAERRVIRLRLGGEERYAAVEDAGRL